MLAKVVLLASLRSLQLLGQSPTEEWPEGCLVRALGDADRVLCHDLLVEVAHTTGNSGEVEKMGKAGESVCASGLYEAWLHDIRPVIELRGTDDSSFEAPD
jgi:hypothetical protein